MLCPGAVKEEQDGYSQRLLFWLMAVSTATCAAIWAAVRGGGFCRWGRGRDHEENRRGDEKVKGWSSSWSHQNFTRNRPSPHYLVGVGGTHGWGGLRGSNHWLADRMWLRGQDGLEGSGSNA